MKNLLFQKSKTSTAYHFNYSVKINTTKVGSFSTQKDYLGEYATNPIYTIYNIKVHKKYRRQGIGSAIIMECENQAREKGLSQILCQISPLDENTSNEELIDFYKHNNFEIQEIGGQVGLFAIKKFKLLPLEPKSSDISSNNVKNDANKNCGK